MNAAIDTVKKCYVDGEARDGGIPCRAEMMKCDPENHTRWKHKWEWYHGGNVWDNIATGWAGKED